ncbi:hypothetical protein ACCO45_000078 [Purpureocillium lilacinum]|uniref:Uncharacterized protein n=1 Tax=Purpureocillium lilacinum TaxID=33203 RepID=A0ACC4E5Q7_PURLI
MLNVLVVGAGIAGLSAAVSLRRAGHYVHVYERSALNNEIGAAINVPPNATRFLLAWGLDPVRWRFVTSRGIRYLDPFTLEPLRNVVPPKGGPRAFGGTDLFYAHRVDLHDALKWLATKEDGPGAPVTIHLSTHIVAYDSSKPSIFLQGGQEITGDIVIAADGVHSLASDVILGRKNFPVPPVHSNSCYRFLIPAAALEEDPDTRFWVEDCNGWARLVPHGPTKRRIVSYPCRNNTIFNFVGVFYDKNMDSGGAENWQASVDISQVLDRYSDFHPKLLGVIRKAKEAKRYPLLYRHPLPTMCKGRMALAGDAAHPMLPHHGQGGAQGLEDGLAIGIVLHGASSPSEIEKRLGIYDQVRCKRASAIQILSNAGLEQFDLVQHELRQYLEPDKIPSEEHARHVQVQLRLRYRSRDSQGDARSQPGLPIAGGLFECEVVGVPGQ